MVDGGGGSKSTDGCESKRDDDEVVEEGKDLDQITCRFRVQIRTYQLKIYI